MRVFPSLFTSIGSFIYNSSEAFLPICVVGFLKEVGTVVASSLSSLLGRVSAGGQSLYQLFSKAVLGTSDLKDLKGPDLKKAQEDGIKEFYISLSSKAGEESRQTLLAIARALAQEDPSSKICQQVIAILGPTSIVSEEKEGMPSEIIRVPDDGNCLYHSVSYGFEFVQGRVLSIQDLRQLAVAWLKHNENDPMVQMALLGALETYREHQMTGFQAERDSLNGVVAQDMITEDEYKEVSLRLENQEKVLTSLDGIAYLELAEQEGFFGGEAEIYALSQLLNIGIEVDTYNADQKISSICYNEQALRRISLVYTRSPFHYNLQVKA